MSNSSNIDFFMKWDILSVAVKKVRKISKIVLNSPQILRKFKKESTKVPKLDVKTRWSSLFEMIERLTEISNPLQHLFVDLKLEWTLSDVEIKSIECLKKLLGPCKLFVDKMSKSKCNLVTAELNIEELLESLEDVRKTINSNDEFIELFITTVKKRLLERRTEMSDILLFLCQNKISLSNRKFYQNPTNEKIKEYLNFLDVSIKLKVCFIKITISLKIKIYN